jgi:hypothetical protein
LPRARAGDLGKEIQKKRKNLCREPNSWLLAKNDGMVEPSPDRQFCREPWFAEGRALGIFVLCRELLFAERAALGNEFFADGWFCRGLALSKEDCCRAPDICPSAKHPALGKDAISGSDRTFELPDNFLCSIFFGHFCQDLSFTLKEVN